MPPVVWSVLCGLESILGWFTRWNREWREEPFSNRRKLIFAAAFVGPVSSAWSNCSQMKWLNQRADEAWFFSGKYFSPANFLTLTCRGAVVERSRRREEAVRAGSLSPASLPRQRRGSAVTAVCGGGSRRFSSSSCRLSVRRRSARPWGPSSRGRRTSGCRRTGGSKFLGRD